jgi:hypothetical protein
MGETKILLQLDTDLQPSVFDSVVAIDAGVEQLLRHNSITPSSIRSLVHGTIFTRGQSNLRSTAIFVGGSDVAAAEKICAEIRNVFFGPMRVSVMLDPNGANTTAAAAVLAASKHVQLAGARALVLAATGPVGRRAVRLLARQRAVVGVVSRSLLRAQEVCDAVAAQVPGCDVSPHAAVSDAEIRSALEGVVLVIAAGAAGTELVSDETRRAARTLRVAIDLNAVPPTGLAGVDVTDRGKERDGVACYGAIGIGGTKMKLHKAAISRLFEANDQVLDAEEILALGYSLMSDR